MSRRSSRSRSTPGLAPPETGSPPAYEVVEDESPEPCDSPYEVVAETGGLTPEFVAPPRPPWQPPTRRELYARLAAVRRVLAAWAETQAATGRSA